MTRSFASLLVCLCAAAGIVSAQRGDPKVLEAQRLKRLSALTSPDGRTQVAVGQHVPDFTLTDQQGTRVTLSTLQGKVVAATFGYIRCPNPAYCFRLASNLGQLQARLKEHVGRDLVLLTVMLDPEHDRDHALAEYAHVWTLQPAGWHFLTGAADDVQRVARGFGVEFLREEGAVIHSLNTVVIDRHGTLVANLEGSDISPDRLIQLVSATLGKP